MMFDPSKLEGIIADLKEEMAPDLEKGGGEGAFARMQTEILPVLMRWKWGEMERGIEKTELVSCMALLLASQLTALAVEVVGRPLPSDHGHYECAQNILEIVSSEVQRLLEGSDNLQSRVVYAESSH